MRSAGRDAPKMSGAGVAQRPGAATERADGQGTPEMQELHGHIEETRRLCGSLTHMLQKDAQARLPTSSRFFSVPGLAGASQRPCLSRFPAGQWGVWSEGWLI